MVITVSCTDQSGTSISAMTITAMFIGVYSTISNNANDWLISTTTAVLGSAAVP